MKVFRKILACGPMLLATCKQDGQLQSWRDGQLQSWEVGMLQNGEVAQLQTCRGQRKEPRRNKKEEGRWEQGREGRQSSMMPFPVPCDVECFFFCSQARRRQTRGKNGIKTRKYGADFGYVWICDSVLKQLVRPRSNTGSRGMACDNYRLKGRHVLYAFAIELPSELTAMKRLQCIPSLWPI